MNSSRILLIYTGGTIGMVQEPESGLLKPFNFDHLIAEIPELNKFNYHIDTVSFQEPIDSSNMSPEIWTKLAVMIQDAYDNYDGFVILHGSDTMAYTASALSFMLSNLSKPVILTGSQLPIGVVRTDGKENLITAIEIAAAKENGQAVVPEVAIYFEYSLYRGNRTAKISATHFEAFDSPNYPILAEAGIDINYNYSAIAERNSKPLEVFTDFIADVGVIHMYPGIHQSYVDGVLLSSELKVIVLLTYGSGNMPMNEGIENAIKRAIDAGKHIVNITQCLRGSVKQGSYETSKFLNEVRVISGKDMTLESAITKAMYILGKHPDSFKEIFPKNVAGELSN